MRTREGLPFPRPFGRQYFVLDPHFPSRLVSSDFKRAAGFLHFLLKKYSTSDLSFDTDRDVAIYSLLERMEQAFKTEVRNGILRRFFGSLLLWRRNQEKKTAPILYKDRSVPSWSWMVYPGGIDFIVDAAISLEVARPKDLDFGKALKVKARIFGGNCQMEQREEGYALVDGTKKVGSLWFDVADLIRFKACNCVVVSMVRDRETEDARKTYHILLVREKSGGEGFERVGVGKVEAQYVSRDFVAGMLW